VTEPGKGSVFTVKPAERRAHLMRCRGVDSYGCLFTVHKVAIGT